MAFENYSQLEIHLKMLKDMVRIESFKQALYKTINKDSIVLDVGAGTGILSLLALSAGAKRVYAVEKADIIEILNQIIKENELTSKIITIKGDMHDVFLPEKVDVIVSEFIGSLGINEYFLPAVIYARDKYLKPGGKIVPELVSSYIVPIVDYTLEEEINYWDNYNLPFKMSTINDAILNEPIFYRNDLTIDNYIDVPKSLWDVNIITAPYNVITNEFIADLKFKASKCNYISGFLGWFNATLTEKITLTNSPDSNKTHWGQTVFPIGRKIKLNENEMINLKIKCIPIQPGHCRFRGIIHSESIGKIDKTWENKLFHGNLLH